MSARSVNNDFTLRRLRGGVKIRASEFLGGGEVSNIIGDSPPPATASRSHPPPQAAEGEKFFSAKSEKLLRTFACISAATLLAFLGGCTSARQTERPVATTAQNRPTLAKGCIPTKTREELEAAKKAKPGADGKYYLDDGPPQNDESARLAAATEPTPKWEAIPPGRNRPYSQFGRRYIPYKTLHPHSERGRASWYGKRYHGRKTSSGEEYDMFKMSAAHPILPIPSYARVIRMDTCESVVVRVNDRGPFLGGRVIDLSYAAAHRLGMVQAGTAEVMVESIIPAADSSGDDSSATDNNSQTAVAIPIKPAAGTELKLQLPESQAPSAEAKADFDSSAAQSDSNNTSPADSNSQNESAVLDSGVAVAAEVKVYIQLGAFAKRANADNMWRIFAKAGFSLPHKIYLRDGLHLFLVGPYESTQSARRDDATLCNAHKKLCGFLTRAP